MNEQPTKAVKTYRTRSAVLDRTESSATAFARREGIVINVFQVRGGYEARAGHMGPPRESHRFLRTIDGPALLKQFPSQNAAPATPAETAGGTNVEPEKPAPQPPGRGQRGQR